MSVFTNSLCPLGIGFGHLCSEPSLTSMYSWRFIIKWLFWLSMTYNDFPEFMWLSGSLLTFRYFLSGCDSNFRRSFSFGNFSAELKTKMSTDDKKIPSIDANNTSADSKNLSSKNEINSLGISLNYESFWKQQTNRQILT